MQSLKVIGILIALVIVGGAIYVYAGAYNVGADAAHTKPVGWFLSTVSDRSVAMHAKDIQPPANLSDEKMILEGAGHYSEMCTGCHLAPGIGDNAMRRGLNPQPPNLALPSDLSPGEMFWVIKHGVKMTGMPAWGKTHSDQEVWAITAFVQRLPTMTPVTYQDIVAKARSDETAAH